MEVKIQTLTPLWTGGVDAGKCDRIHETGILGSLRWWMEVLVRGMGGNVCDLTEQKCLYKNGLCEVCKIFGAEGQKRRFRLEVVRDNTRPDETVSSKIELKHDYKDREGKTKTRISTWWFREKPRSGTFTVQIQSLHPNFKPKVIGGLIQFIADWSALGARPQMGFGVIQILEGDRINTQPLWDWLMTTAGNNTYPDLPSLQNISLAKIRSKDSNPSFQEQDTFNLKYNLRGLFRTERDTAPQQNQGNKPILKQAKGNIQNKGKEEQELRHFIMGTVEDEQMATKIKISRAYDNDQLIRVWGWVPAQAEVYKNGWNREKIVDTIYQHLKAKYTLHDWREMNSVRDCVKPNESNAKAFLRSLLELQESSDAV